MNTIPMKTLLRALAALQVAGDWRESPPDQWLQVLYARNELQAMLEGLPAVEIKPAEVTE